ncbi:SDR family NAD(P)-dependent oxidoreductase [Photobacterium satsumensis]|uniref:type I polyketide synthase n=1 Tax=Photobacterium satsumensis TaxID=2910239 RepID=UPI003D0E7738
MNEVTEFDDRIAVIGMSGRFPGAENHHQFWQNLQGGVESVTTLSKEDLRGCLQGLDPISAQYVSRQMKNPNYVNAGFFLEQTEGFDAGFFGFNPSELELIDPQHRIFMETSWEALEDGGYDPYRYPGRVGVYAGTLMSRYLLYNVFHLMHSERDFLVGIGNEVDYLPTRVSYRLNLKGPSVSVQTACSTSLVAIHLACQALLNGECDMALAGGSVLQVPHKQGYLYQEGSMTAPDGHCRAFDAKAKGTVFSAGGSGTVLLKRLDEALADGDQIYSVIRGTAVNNDGLDKVGYTAPGVDGQVAVITEALEVAGVSPDTLSYVEAHGTGTPLGDPIEIDALTKAYREYTDQNQFCAIGSLKTNIGHLAAAAGVASLMKVSLAMKHGEIPPSLNYSKPNPRIDFANSPFYVNDKLVPWHGVDGVKRAGISSFGVGGTNAHAIVEEAPVVLPSDDGRHYQLISLSAKSAKALDAQRCNLADYLEQNTSLNFADLAYTLHIGRHPFEHRFQCVASNTEEAISQLRKGLNSPQSPAMADTRPLVFMFPGQGAQYVGMAQGLYDSEPVFRETFDDCASVLAAHTGIELASILFAGNQVEEAALRLQQTEVTQPALFVVEYALAKLLASWGISPGAMIGHSIGEWVAACLAGVFSVDDAIRLVARRASLMGQQEPGTMAAVRVSASEAEDMLCDGLDLAAVNGPELCVLSGSHEAIGRLAAKGVTVQPLHTSHAFHSAMMEPVLEPLRREFADVQLNPPTIPFVSNVSGTWITAEQAMDPEYWLAHLRGTVQFAKGIHSLLEQGDCIFLEVGPGTSLSGLTRLSLAGQGASVTANCLAHPKMKTDALESLLQAVGNLWCAGHEPDWHAFYSLQRRLRVSAPTYAFQRTRYWVETQSERKAELALDAGERKPLEEWFYTPSWTRGMPARDVVSGQRLLLLHGGSGPERALAEQLKRQDVALIDAQCTEGEAFAKNADHSYTLDMTRSEHFAELISQLAAEDRLPEGVVHTLTLQPDTDATRELAQQQEKGFFSLLWLSQALGSLAEQPAMSVQIVTSGLYDVLGSESLRPAVATVLGPRKVLPLEFPSLSCRIIDIAVDQQVLQLDTALLGRELLSGDGEDAALRNRHRWTLDYQPLSVPPSEDGVDSLREHGVYLITGGLGGLGLVHAHKLATLKPSTLVLLGRSALPPREQWEALLGASDTSPELVEKLSKIRAIEALGSRVEVAAADLADETEMEALIAGIKHRHGGLHGIVHCAGVAGGGLIQLKQREEAEKVFNAKLYGTSVLAKVTQREALDFVILASSLFAVSGGVGQVDYCAANNFLDVMAKSGQFAHARKVVSVNWDAWQEVGMAKNMLSELSQTEQAALPASNISHRLLHSGDTATGEYTMVLNPASEWLLSEHQINNMPTVPGTLYLELARAAFVHHQQLAPEAMVELRDCFFTTPLQLSPGAKQHMVLALGEQSGEWVFDVKDEAGHPHVFGKLAAVEQAEVKQRDLASIRQRLAHHISEGLSIGGDQNGESGAIMFGKHWQSVEAVSYGGGEALIRLALKPDCRDDVEAFILHPALLDVATGPTAGYCVPDHLAAEGALFLPASYGRMRVYRPLTESLYSHMRYQPAQSDNDSVTLAIELLDSDGILLAEIEQFVLRRVSAEPLANDQSSLFAGGDEESAAIMPAEGAEVFARLLAGEHTEQLVVSTTDLPLLFEQIASQQFGAESTNESSQSTNRTMHDRPELDTAYVEPEGEVEQALTAIWQQVLGLNKIGRHDNFFDLGADSVLGVQIVSVARENGVIINPGQLFEHQTIAELAQVAEAVFEVQGGVQEATALPLSLAQVHSVDSGIELSLEPGLALSNLVEALESMVVEASCFRYQLGEQQLIPANPESLDIRLEMLDAGEEVWPLLAEQLAAHPELPFAAGYRGDNRGARLAVLFRGALVDASTVSVLHQYLSARLAGQSASLPEGPGYALWHEQHSSQSPTALAMADSWPITAASQAPKREFLQQALPADFELTEALLAQHHIAAGELILAALASSVSEVLGQPSPALAVKNSYRRLDASGQWDDTLGNLAVVTPTSYQLDPTEDLLALLTQVKEAYRQQAADSLENASEALSLTGSPILFDFELAQRGADGDVLTVVPALQETRLLADFPIQLRMFKPGRSWEVLWLYDGERIASSVIKGLHDSLMSELNRSLDQLQTAQSTIYTPTDFPDAGLDKDALNSFMSDLFQGTEK